MPKNGQYTCTINVHELFWDVYIYTPAVLYMYVLYILLGAESDWLTSPQQRRGKLCKLFGSAETPIQELATAWQAMEYT